MHWGAVRNILDVLGIFFQRGRGGAVRPNSSFKPKTKTIQNRNLLWVLQQGEVDESKSESKEAKLDLDELKT